MHFFRLCSILFHYLYVNSIFVVIFEKKEKEKKISLMDRLNILLMNMLFSDWEKRKSVAYFLIELVYLLSPLSSATNSELRVHFFVAVQAFVFL